jgi:uncharacterized integral membrane protein
MRILSRLVGAVLAAMILVVSILLMVGSREPAILQLALVPGSIELPLFAAVLAFAVAGFIAGGIVTWFGGGRWRRLARESLMALEVAESTVAGLKADLAKARADADRADATTVGRRPAGNDNSPRTLLPARAR